MHMHASLVCYFHAEYAFTNRDWSHGGTTSQKYTSTYRRVQSKPDVENAMSLGMIHTHMSMTGTEYYRRQK